ncbi:MAG: flagellar motor switch protein FliN [Fimbriimonadaceae bacterium]|nr:flagellar motor switch protein FliN [Fimbriimonadaceae bacterium]QYK57127.1 MAG: flagellar motor switch protein FliN [Fimbriimonadaceae bacterium]
MSVSPEIIEKFRAYQPQVWQSVKRVITDQVDQFSLDDSNVEGLSTAEATRGLATGVQIAFAFANAPEDNMVVFLPQLTVNALSNRDEAITLDDNLVAELRSTFEGVVQGICLAIGTILDEPMVASGLQIRLQDLHLPESLDRSEEVVKVSTSGTVNGQTVQVFWFLSRVAAATICGESTQSDEGNPFKLVSGGVEGRHGDPSFLEDASLEIIMDIPLEVSVELGRVKMPVKDVLELGPGSIVEIDKAAGEPVDVLVNNRLVARGEVVVIDDNFGVRITEIVSLQERLQKLNEAA